MNLCTSTHIWRMPVAGWLAIVLMAAVFLPLLPGLYQLLQDGLTLRYWQALWQNPQILAALASTLSSTIISWVLALGLSLSIATSKYPSNTRQTAVRRLPLLLALPHAAFAIGFAFLFAPSGWLARIFANALSWPSPPDWLTVNDPYGISLGLALAIKESFFLLWILANVLGEKQITQQITVARSMGYQTQQIWRCIILPQIAPRLRWPLLAVVAYSLSVVDMALILGPSTPPTLAVLTWQWLSDPDPQMQALGSVAALLLLGLLLLIAAVLRLLEHYCLRPGEYLLGIRQPNRYSPLPALYQLGVLICASVFVLLLVWSIAQGWFFPAVWPTAITLSGWQQADLAPLSASLWLGLASSGLGLVIVLLWLEWGPQRYQALLYTPLIIPVMPLAAAQYFTLLKFRLDGSAIGLIWSHLLWVLPYMLLSLVGVYRQFDHRLMLTAQALGYSRLQACLRVKWPLLMKPILAALALGFAVSIAQYLPTLFAGAGRFTTVTTEAIALSSGGNRRTLAVQAVLLMSLPLLAFGLTGLISHWRAKTRQGLR